MFRKIAVVSWGVAFVGAVLLALQPVSIQAQFVFGIAVATIMGILLILRVEGMWRHIAMAFGLVVVMRYIYWRSTSTLPPVDDLFNFIPGATLLAAEIYCVVMLAISFFVVSDPLERKPAPAFRDEDLPTVDVFVPSYNEDPEMLATTLSAAKLMDYPEDKLAVYLLDDGGTDQKVNSPDPRVAAPAARRRKALQTLCARLGVTYLTRERNEHAKAGNLNAALPRTKGDLIAVFDADHAPFRSFLKDTVGHFLKVPKLFLVQTPHVFLNPDPVEKNLSTFKRMPSENEMFYSVIQRGLDKWNAAFFCGSAAVLNRQALVETNGFSGLSITEDCETALDLHSRGWKSVYVEKPLIAGLQPETFASFIGQRTRWCQGMIQTLILKNPLVKRGLTPAQRIAYLSSSLFWLFPLPRLIFTFSPLLYIFFSLEIYAATLQEFIAYTLVYLTVNVLMQSYLYGKVRWPWISELYEYVQSLYLAPAIASVVMKPRKPVFKVTDKGLTQDKERLSELALPYFISFGILAIAEAVVFYRYFHETVLNDHLVIVGLWNSINLVVAGLGLGVVAEIPERRRRQRMAVLSNAELILGDTCYPVSVEDVSIGGARIRSLGEAIREHGPTTLGVLRVKPSLPHLAEADIPFAFRQTMVDERGAFHGVQFLALGAPQYQAIADLMFKDNHEIEQFRDKRRVARGIASGTLEFFFSSLRHSLRGMAYAVRQLARDSHGGPAGDAAPALQTAPVPQAAPTAPAFESAPALDPAAALRRTG